MKLTFMSLPSRLSVKPGTAWLPGSASCRKSAWYLSTQSVCDFILQYNCPPKLWASNFCNAENWPLKLMVPRWGCIPSSQPEWQSRAKRIVFRATTIDSTADTTMSFKPCNQKAYARGVMMRGFECDPDPWLGYLLQVQADCSSCSEVRGRVVVEVISSLGVRELWGSDQR